MKLVIVSGPEATCKSYIGHELASSLACTYLSKDMIKEAMFDEHPRSTWDYKWYESRAKDAFFARIAQLVRSGTDMIVESNFIGPDKSRLQACIPDSTEVVEIYCNSKGLTSFRRFVARNETGRRHKGHHDRRWYPKILVENLLRYIGVRWPSRPSGITSRLLEVDTTDFEKINLTAIEAFVTH